MTSQRLVEDFARWLWAWDQRWEPDRIPDGYVNHAAVFLAGELGQRLQHVGRIEAVYALHKPAKHPNRPDVQYCWCCRDDDGFRKRYPCPTIKALDGTL